MITNTRPDHLDVMGPEEKDVALALAGSIPVKAKLFTAENKYLSIFKDAAGDRQTQLVHVAQEAVDSVKDEEMAHFPYV